MYVYVYIKALKSYSGGRNPRSVHANRLHVSRFDKFEALMSLLETQSRPQRHEFRSCFG